jgi:methionyl-tRNA formyltransferase
MASPPTTEAARELGIEVHQTGDVNAPEVVEAIRAVRPDAIPVCAFGQLVKEPLLDEFVLLNVHPSLVPRWRGAAPIERAVMAGDRITGVTIMRVTAGLDSGPIAIAEEVSIDEDDDYASLSAKLADRGGELLVRALDQLESSEIDFAYQDDSKATYAEKISPDERHLDPSLPATELDRTVRALAPHIGVHLELDNGERLGVRAATAVAEDIPVGELHRRDGDLLLGCAQGALRLEVLQPPGGRPMPADDFLRGHETPSRAR